MKKIVLKASILMSLFSILSGCAKQEDIVGEWFGYAYNEDVYYKVNITDDMIEYYTLNANDYDGADMYQIYKTGFENGTSYALAKTTNDVIISFVFPDKNDTSEMFIFEIVDEEEPTRGYPFFKLDKDESPNPEEGLIDY